MAPFTRLLLAWPLCGALLGAFVALCAASGVQAHAPLVVYLGLVSLPLVVGTMAFQGPSKASLGAGLQGAGVAVLASFGMAFAGGVVTLLVAVLFHPDIARSVAILVALTAFLSLGVGAAFTPIQRTTKRHVAAASAGWIVGTLTASALFLLLVVALPPSSTPLWLSAFLLGCIFATPAFASIALFDRFLTPTQKVT